MKREEIKTYKDACKVNRRSGYNKSAGVFHLFSNYGLDPSPARVQTSLKIKEREDGNYIIENFKELLQDWFWGD